MNHKKNVITLHTIYKDYTQGNSCISVLRGVSMLFEQANSYAIIGVSGSGKSTLMHIAGGLDLPTNGDVFFNMINVKSMTGKKRDSFLNKHIGFIYQFHYLIQELTVIENIMLPGLIKNMIFSECIDRAQELLKLICLEGKGDRFPSQLSGGEQQRVGVARALFNKPTFIFADEPTGSLDRDNADKIIDILLLAQKQWEIGLIICSHDPYVYNRLDNVYTLKAGVLVQ